MHEAMGRSCTRSSGAHAETHRALVRGGNSAHAKIIWGLRASPLRSCTALLVPVGEESTAWHSRVWYGTGWYGTVRHGNAGYGTGWHSMARDGTGCNGTAQDGTVQHGMARYSTVWHGTGCSGTAQHVLRFAPAAGGHQDDPGTCRAPWLTPHPQHITGIRISPSLSPLPSSFSPCHHPPCWQSWGFEPAARLLLSLPAVPTHPGHPPAPSPAPLPGSGAMQSPPAGGAAPCPPPLPLLFLPVLLSPGSLPRCCCGWEPGGGSQHGALIPLRGSSCRCRIKDALLKAPKCFGSGRKLTFTLKKPFAEGQRRDLCRSQKLLP